MSRLEDEDGIDGPFERAMRRAEREDAGESKSKIEVSTAPYVSSHGKEPRGRGGWAFAFDGADALDDLWWFVGLYAAARRAAIAEAKARGARKVEVQS